MMAGQAKTASVTTGREAPLFTIRHTFISSPAPWACATIALFSLFSCLAACSPVGKPAVPHCRRLGDQWSVPID